MPPTQDPMHTVMTATIFVLLSISGHRGRPTWRWLYRLQAGVDAPVVAAALVPLTLGVRAAAWHLAGSLRQGLGRRWAPVVLLVVGTVRMKRVLIILAKRRKGDKGLA